MAVSPVLIIKLIEDSGISVRARFYDDFAEHEIVLNSVLNYWWANDMPPATKFLELFDSVIKRTVNEVLPHKVLNLKYEVKANETLDRASEIGINLLSVSADGIGFKIENGSFSLKGIRKVEPDFEGREVSTVFDHVIETPDIVLKKYNEMKR